jgi:hypothetical protein
MIIAKYSNLPIQIPQFSIDNIHSLPSKISFAFLINIKKQTIMVDETSLSKEQKFILFCIQNAELFEICTDIFNEFEKKTDQEILAPIKHQVAMIGMNRTLRNISNIFDPRQSYTFV